MVFMSIEIIKYRLSMEYDYDLDVDEHDMTNNSGFLPGKIENAAEGKYAANTLTKGFFNVDEEEYETGGRVSGSPVSTGKGQEEGGKKRRRTKNIK